MFSKLSGSTQHLGQFSKEEKVAYMFLSVINPACLQSLYIYTLNHSELRVDESQLLMTF